MRFKRLLGAVLLERILLRKGRAEARAQTRRWQPVPESEKQGQRYIPISS
jgi:hypothetical protein